MELKELVGEHVLDAVDFSNEEVKTWGDHFENCEVMRFRLDGKVYSVVEDPSDGYRSSMRDIHIDENAKMRNIFDPIRVLARHRDRGRYDDDDVLELLDIKNGQIIF